MADSLRSRFFVSLTIEGYGENLDAGFVVEETMYAACRDIVHLLEKAKDDDAYLYVEQEAEKKVIILTPSSVKLINMVKGDPIEEAPKEGDGGDVRWVNEFVSSHDNLLLRRL